MTDSKQGGAGETGEDTDDLLYSDCIQSGQWAAIVQCRGTSLMVNPHQIIQGVPDVEDVFGVSLSTPGQFSRDHCDLLLDAIDAQLSRLQAQRQGVRGRGDDGSSKRLDHNTAALAESQPVSKDTGLSSALSPNDPPSTPPLLTGPSETQELSSEERRSGQVGAGSAVEDEDGRKGVASRVAVTEEEELEREQCLWRLELLLGRAHGGFGGSPPRQADSVCTEDFTARFRVAMLEIPGVDKEAGPGSKGLWEDTSPGPGNGTQEAMGAQGIRAVIPALGKMAVGVDRIAGGHFQDGGALRYDQASPQSQETVGSRAGPGLSMENVNKMAITGDRPPQGFKEVSNYQLPSPGGDADTELSGAKPPDQMETSHILSPLECVELSDSQEPSLIGGMSISLTSLTDPAPFCDPMSPGVVPVSNGTNWTSTPRSQRSEGGVITSFKHKSDISAEKAHSSRVQTSSRRWSCPEPIAEATDRKSSLHSPSPDWTPLPWDPHLCPPPPPDRPRVELRHGSGEICLCAPPCFGSAPSLSTNGVLLEAGSRTGFSSAPGPPSSSGTAPFTVSLSSMNTTEAEGVPDPPVHSTVRHLAGVPVKSFDSVTIDSDLDSVQTDQVRKHFQKALQSSAAVRCAHGLHRESLCSDQSDPELLLQPRSKFTLRAVRGNVPGGSRLIRRSRHPRREAASVVLRCDCSEDEESAEVEEEEEEAPVQAACSGLGPREQLPKNSTPWRRRASRLKRPHLRALTGEWLDSVNSDWLLLEEGLHALRQNCLREEERLKRKRDLLHDTELSLTALLQQKQHAMQELECARLRAEQAEREGRSLEVGLRDSRTQADSTRSQLRVLQAQREARVQELTDLEAELSALRRHKAALQQRAGAELEQRVHGGSLSVLEREEMDRQLDSAKAELFAEQRRARHRLDSVQERLEEAQQELEQRVEEVRVLRESHCGLEEQLTNAQRHGEELEQRRQEEVQALDGQLQELQHRLEEQEGRVGTLEDLLSQKALQQEEAQEERRSLEEQLLSEREAHRAKLQEVQEEAMRDKEVELEQLKTELSLAGKQEIDLVLEQAEVEKQEALKELTLSHSQQSDALQRCIQLKEEELRKMKEALEREEESARKRREETRAEAQELVQQAVQQERRKREVEKGEELRVQREELEDQGRRAVERVSEELEREKRTSLALQHKIVELQTRLQEQECEAALQQRELSAALAAHRKALGDEQQEELQRLRTHLEQEAQREVLQLKQALEESRGEVQTLQAALTESRRSQEGEEGVSREELQQQRGAVAELGLECRRLQELLERGGATGGAVHHLPHDPTVAQVAHTFRPLREQLYALVSRLQQDLDTQRHTVQQLSRDKERELRNQKEQLTAEKERALDSLRERLIQEHIEELSSLQRVQLRDSGGGEAGGVAASLRRQLQDKDRELREVQRNMGRWKEQTAARLARKFEEELTTELEKRVPRSRTEQQRKLQRLESEMRQLTMEYGDPGGVLRSTSTPSLLSLDPPAAPPPRDLGTFKLLRHLQGRVRQLRAENSVQSCSPVHLDTHLRTNLGTPFRTRLGTHLASVGDLAGSYLETITQSMERCPVRARPHTRAVPN